MNFHEKTMYSLNQIQKVIEITPVFKQDDNEHPRRQILCKYQENNILSEELIPFEQICIIPVSKNDVRKNCIEKGIFSYTKLDEKFNVIVREGEIHSTKLYVDDDKFHRIISTFSKKTE